VSAVTNRLLGVSIVVTIIMMVLTSLYLDWSRALVALGQADLWWLLAALVLMVINYLLRTWRFRVLLDLTGKSFPATLAVTMLHGMFNYVLPTKSGELSYPLLAKQHLGVSLNESTATLIAARFFDFGVIALLLPLTLIQYSKSMPDWVVPVSAGYCLMVLVTAGGLLFYLRRTQAPQMKTATRFTHRVSNAVQRTLECLRVIDRRRQYFTLWIQSYAIWLCVLMMYYSITSALGFEATLGQMVLISVILIPLSLSPVQGFANLGTHEAGWVAAFSLFGYGFDDAFSLAVTSHVVLFVLFVLIGFCGMLLVARRGA